jgi:hypothetical protein
MQTTLGKYIEKMKDLDAYIAKGGRLLNFGPLDISQLPPVLRGIVVKEMGPERLARMGRFLVRVSQLTPQEDAPIRNVLTEKQVRAAWRESEVGSRSAS